MQRRNASVDRYYKLQEELEKKAGETKLAHEKKVIDEQMDLERHERKTIKNKKKSELKNAQEQLFADLDEVNQLDAELSQKNQEDSQREELQKALEKLAKMGPSD